MSPSIGTSLTPSASSLQSAATRVAAPPPAMRAAFIDLGQALHQGDLDAAKSAYRAVIQAAPDGMTWPKGSPFAQLGKALIAGDMDAAKSAYADMLRVRRGGPAPTDPLPTPAPVPKDGVPSPSGGTAGLKLSVVA